MWFWISLNYATFGLKTKNRKIVKAPPIARWVLGKDRRVVLKYYKIKGAKIKALDFNK